LTEVYQTWRVYRAIIVFVSDIFLPSETRAAQIAVVGLFLFALLR